MDSQPWSSECRIDLAVPYVCAISPKDARSRGDKPMGPVTTSMVTDVAEMLFIEAICATELNIRMVQKIDRKIQPEVLVAPWRSETRMLAQRHGQ
jgi:hypothetical protein